MDWGMKLTYFLAIPKPVGIAIVEGFNQGENISARYMPNLVRGKNNYFFAISTTKKWHEITSVVDIFDDLKSSCQLLCHQAEYDHYEEIKRILYRIHVSKSDQYKNII